MQELYFTYYESPVGLLKIGGTETYITEVSFIDNREQIAHGEPGLSDMIHYCTEQLIEYFTGRRKTFDLPVHQEGTEFQQRVWNQLLAVPFGKTASYLDMAKKIGRSKMC